MHPVFIDKTLNENFLKNGFIKLKLLNKKEVQEIKTILKQYYFNQTSLSETLSVSLWSDNLALKVFADNLIKKYLLEKLNSILQEYEPIWGDVLIKQPHLTKTFELHQDWTFVDEQQYMSVNVWCPLQDVNYWNGGLQVVPKSHLFLDKIRGLNITPSYSEIVTEIKKKYVVNIEAEMGEAIIFSHALLHASPPNRTLKNRIAIGLNLKPKNIPILHYIFTAKTKNIEKYIVDSNYFLQIGQKTDFANSIKNGFNDYIVDGTLADTIAPVNHKITAIEFNKQIAHC